jgi:hypothetical protein
MNLRFGNETYGPTDSQSEEPEDQNYSNNNIDDNRLRRTNPPRFDFHKDWTNFGPDDEMAVRDNQSKISWRQILADTSPGFIPTNQGMQTPDDIIDYLGYESYSANRDYDKRIAPNSDEPNPNYDPEKSRLKWRNFWMKHAGWSDNKLNIFEKRYNNKELNFNKGI